jgi:hypothetical protein
MKEKKIVDSLLEFLNRKKYMVATEVANLYRSADIAVLDDKGKVWVIECKVSSISKAIKQLKTHKLSADKVFIGTIYRRTKKSTINCIKEAGIGLIYIMPDGSIKEAIDESSENIPWEPARKILIERIKEAI